MFVDYTEPTAKDIKKWSQKGSVSYLGLFVDDQTKVDLIRFCKNNGIPVHGNIVCHHITLKFKPPQYVVENAEGMLGKKFEARITGYGTNENVTALRVSLSEIQSDNVTPHITVSLSENGEAKMSNDLHYKDIEGPVFTTTLGIYGRGRALTHIPWK